MEYDFYPKYIEHVKDGNDVTNDSIDYSRFVLLFTPAYILQVTPNNKVCIKTKFSTPIQLFSSNNGDRVSYKNGAESSRIPYDVKETDLLANLKTEIAIQYKPIPDKLNINLACSVTSPTFNKIKVVDNKVTTTNTLSFQGFASSVNVGFSYTFAKILMLDCNWNILQIDADSLNSTLDAIWNKSIYIGLSAKF